MHKIYGNDTFRIIPYFLCRKGIFIGTRSIRVRVTRSSSPRRLAILIQGWDFAATNTCIHEAAKINLDIFTPQLGE